jgi:hypothetical protein
VQSITIEKGQYLTLHVSSVEEFPSKNKDWDSRWLFKGTTPAGDSVSTYVGNKALTQQCARQGLSVADLSGKSWTLERTAEGYFNLLAHGKSPKPGSVSLGGKLPPAKDEPKHDFDRPVDGEAPADDSDTRIENGRAALRGEIWWALSTADEMVGTILAAHEQEFTPECLRSVVALAATLHISMKNVR